KTATNAQPGAGHGNGSVLTQNQPTWSVPSSVQSSSASLGTAYSTVPAVPGWISSRLTRAKVATWSEPSPSREVGRRRSVAAFESAPLLESRHGAATRRRRELRLPQARRRRHAAPLHAADPARERPPRRERARGRGGPRLGRRRGTVTRDRVP